MDTPEAIEKREKDLNQVFKVTLKKREWVTIFNIIASQQYNLKDAKLLNPIIDTLYKEADLQSLEPKKQEEGLVIE